MNNYRPHYVNSWALVIGINAYQHASPLSYACNDADTIASLLVGELSFPSEQVLVLKDNDASKQNILDEYIGLRGKASNHDDRILVFFAGHGTTVVGSRGPIGYLVPVDGSPNNLNSLIRWDDLTKNAEIIPAKHILFIIDACYGGLAIQRAIPPGTHRFVSDMLQRFSRQVITAGKANETVADGGGPSGTNSIFTGHLIDGLLGSACDENGVLTANLLMNYVYQKVSQDVRSEQTPHYGHIEGDGDFILKTPQDDHLRINNDEDFLVQTVPELPEPAILLEPPSDQAFSLKNGYANPDSPNFGRNDWSSRLGESRVHPDSWNRDVTKCYSWLSLICEPVERVVIGIRDESTRVDGRRSHVLQPHERLPLPRQSMTTIDSALFYDTYYANKHLWGHYLRIDKAGHIEYADSNCIFTDFEGTRLFYYVRIVGLTWQFLFFAKDVLENSGYRGGIRILVSLVGTRGSILGNFSKEKGEGDKFWVDSTERPGFRNPSHFTCPSANLQMQYRLVIGSLNEPKSKEIVTDLAEQLSLAFNHDSMLRCFNYGTQDFPWQQYLQEMQFCSESQT